MIEFLSFVVLGLAGGSLIAALSLGVVLTYRASGVINFAIGANAAFVTYTYWGLTSEGILFIGFPVRILPEGQAFAPALALIVSLVVAAVLGYLQFLLVYRFLRSASTLARIVASSGVLLVLQAAMILSFGTNVRNVETITPRGALTLAPGLTLTFDRLAAVGFILVVTVGLTVLYQRTRFGVRTRAAADSRKGALLVGINPNRLEAINWTLASVVAGAVGILVTPTIGLQPSSITLYIVPVLGAALLAKFTSFWVAAATGLGIGVLQGLVTAAQGMSWFPQAANAPLPGVKEALPFVIIALILIFRGSSLPGRAADGAPRLPRAPRPNRLVLRFAIAIGLALVIVAFAPAGYRQALANSLIGIVVVLSLVVVTGFLGSVTLAQMAIAGVSGFVLSKATQAWGWPGWAGLLVALVAAVVVNLIIALPGLRMRGMQLAIITLAGAMAIQALWFNNPDWGGGRAAASVDPPDLFGIPLGSTESFWMGDGLIPTPGFVLFLLVVTALCALGVVVLRRSTLGARMLAIRGGESAAAAAGINIALVKLVAFAIAGLIAGVAGVLYGYNFGLVTSTRFTELMAISFLAVAFLGGITTVTGAVIGGLLVSQGLLMYLITTIFGISSDFQILLAGVAVLVTVVANPDGIAGFFRDGVARITRRREERAISHRRVPQEVQA